jgi:putative ABC transport system ATP-binding protein
VTADVIDIEFDLTPAEPENDVAVRCENLVHIYGVAGAEVAALRGIDLQVRRGETLALLGPSGSGKSTLLWHLAGLLRPSAGTVEVVGRSLAGLSAAALAELRLREVGVVLQNAARNLLPYLSVWENVRTVQVAGGGKGGRRRAIELLDAVGLDALSGQRAGRLSGGEQQRLALAVALANAPRLLLADEPTSHLDPDSAAAVLELIRQANVDLGTTVVVVTHDATVGAALQRTVTIRDGRIGATGFAGQDFLVVDRDGGIQLPADLLDALPPGSLARAVRTANGVELRRVEAR